MSENTYTIQKKNSKCFYKNNEHGSQIFIFEIVLKEHDLSFNTIRKIKKGNQGNLISSSDSILYQKIDHVKVSILDTNNINNIINAEISIDHSTTYTTHISNDIYLEFNKNSDNFLECNYNIPSF
jgi:hypothetical protein